MSRRYIAVLILAATAVFFISFKGKEEPSEYRTAYLSRFHAFQKKQQQLLQMIDRADLSNAAAVEQVRHEIFDARIAMKQMDFWMRYLQPLAYRSVNGPLPVEWETEVFEKFEKPYRRVGAGLTLALLCLDEPQVQKDTLLQLIRKSYDTAKVYAEDSITNELNSFHHFYLCNRLFLLNLAAIYTTGFECPDPSRIVPELRAMLQSTAQVYKAFNSDFPETPLPAHYLALFDSAIAFAAGQPEDHTAFDHYAFIRNYINPLFVINQKLVQQYRVVSHSLVDYSLNKRVSSIFDKALYSGQSTKGIFHRVTDSAGLALIEQTGRMLFYDPMLSGNNMRSCASCHKPTQYFTDTVLATPQHFNKTEHLARNSPTLINSIYNHLLMLDGKHFTLQHQGKDVITNHTEMMCGEKEMLEKLLSCKQYKAAFSTMLAYTPQEKELTMEHVVSAISLYYGKFSKYYSPFDEAMNGVGNIQADAIAGFNLFMGKAQCGTCHFVPQFNGTKPPYIGSEFEVLGVPADTAYSKVSDDMGRYVINPAKETHHAFRTVTVRNATHTAPYMHNGVFRTLEQVIDFYDAGGGAGHGLMVPNQTLSADSLHLSIMEKKQLIAFIHSLDEQVVFEPAPTRLPSSKIKALNNRKIGGEY